MRLVAKNWSSSNFGNCPVPKRLLLFTMKGVAPPGITMQQIYAASVPYIVFGVLVLVAIFLYPPLATWHLALTELFGSARTTTKTYSPPCPP